MISTLRSGPSILVFGTKSAKELNDYFTAHMGGQNLPPSEALDKVYENSTIIFIVPPGKTYATFEDVIFTTLMYRDADQILADVLNQKIHHLITDTRLGPASILMRTAGDYTRMIEKIRERYDGKVMPLMQALNEGTSESTIISFTERPLNRRVSIKDLKEQNVLVKVRADMLYRDLRSYALRYLNEALVDDEWQEFLIRIYDKFSAYELHFERLMLVLDSMEIGIDLGETWTKEYARPLMPIIVYQLRYISLLPPKEMKKILMGLEYLDNGGRIVDYDLYMGNKKISWADAVNKKFRVKKEACLEYRKKIIDILTPEDLEKMYKLEKDILLTRE